MTVFRLLAVAAIAALFAFPAAAEDTALLIQILPDGSYAVWHADGTSPLSQDEILALEVSATPEGGRSMLTAAGLARAFDTPNGILIRLPALGPDSSLLIDHDGCGGIKVWHARGEVNLTDEELTELVLSALPGAARTSRSASSTPRPTARRSASSRRSGGPSRDPGAERYFSTGSRSACHSGKPSSSRRAR